MNHSKKTPLKNTAKAAAIYFATMLLPVVAIGAPGNGACSTGTLLDVQVHVEMIQAGTMERGRERVKAHILRAARVPGKPGN